MQTYSVRVTRKEYNESIPWTEETMKVAQQKMNRIDHLGGFIYVFRHYTTAARFARLVGVGELPTAI